MKKTFKLPNIFGLPEWDERFFSLRNMGLVLVKEYGFFSFYDGIPRTAADFVKTLRELDSLHEAAQQAERSASSQQTRAAPPPQRPAPAPRPIRVRLTNGTVATRQCGRLLLNFPPNQTLVFGGFRTTGGSFDVGGRLTLGNFMISSTQSEEEFLAALRTIAPVASIEPLS